MPLFSGQSVTALPPEVTAAPSRRQSILFVTTNNCLAAQLPVV